MIRYGTGIFLLCALAASAHGGLATVRIGGHAMGPRATPSAGKQRPTGYALATAKPPLIDGVPDEAAWRAASPLYLSRTLKGDNPATQRTEVRLLRDARCLYIAFRCQEPFLRKLNPVPRRADAPLWSGDSVELFLGPAGRGIYYHFGVACSGGTYDGKEKDASWNSGMKAEAKLGKKEWTAELAIPLEAIQGTGKTPERWSANFNRSRFAGGGLEEFAWSPTYSGSSHVPARFGTLLFRAPPASSAKPKARPERSVRWIPCGEGRGILRFDLSSIPRGSRVFRAELRLRRSQEVDGRYPEAREPVVIHPLFKEYAEGGVPRPNGKPLAVRRPWFDCLDATAAVQAWVKGRPNGGFFFQACPYWITGAAFLDIAYAGTPAKVPPPVSELKVFHRSGQTFITWRALEDLAGKDELTWKELRAIRNAMDPKKEVRYGIYRSTRPITPETLPEAKRIAVVEPLSGWNIHGRNKGRAIDRFIASAKVLNWHHWNPFRGATVEGDYGRDCPVDRFVVDPKKGPLSRATGLYVHTAIKDEEAYYAVLSRVDGVENTLVLNEGNTSKRPLKEHPAEPAPVLQRELPRMPFFNYRDRRLHYVRWVSAPYSNRPCAYYNWSVAVPLRVERKEAGGVPLELNLHRDGYSYWRTHYRNDPDSIVLCPHDFPVKSWWYGYHENLGTLKAWNEGRVRNYTEKRLLWFVRWAMKQWPVDRNRVLVTGCGGGASGSGALHLGLRHPELFNMVLAGHPFPAYRALGKVQGEAERIWGKVEWGLKTENGQSVWEELDLARYVARLPARTELPFVTLTYRDGDPACMDFEEGMRKAGYAMATHYAWGGTRYIPVSAKSTFPFGLRLDIRKDAALPIFWESQHRPNASRNLGFLWKRAEIADAPGRLEIRFRAPHTNASLSFQRLQRFKVAAGKAYTWRLEPLAIFERVKEQPGPREGTVRADADGRLRIPEQAFLNGCYRITVFPGNGKAGGGARP